MSGESGKFEGNSKAGIVFELEARSAGIFGEEEPIPNDGVFVEMVVLSSIFGFASLGLAFSSSGGSGGNEIPPDGAVFGSEGVSSGNGVGPEFDEAEGTGGVRSGSARGGTLAGVEAVGDDCPNGLGALDEPNPGVGVLLKLSKLLAEDAPLLETKGPLEMSGRLSTESSSFSRSGFSCVSVPMSAV